MPDAVLCLPDLLAAKQAREHRHISIAEVARQTNMSRQSASKWFKNRVKTYHSKTIAALCQYFECTPNDLIVIKSAEVGQ